VHKTITIARSLLCPPKKSKNNKGIELIKVEKSLTDQPNKRDTTQPVIAENEVYGEAEKRMSEVVGTGNPMNEKAHGASSS
jgi:hypothetical protein